MAAKRKEEESEQDPSQNVVGSLLKNNKEDHFNFHQEVYYKVPSSSLILNAALDQGLCNSIHRFVGSSRGGKTSCALNFMKNFLDSKDGDRRGLFIKAEGRLGPEIQAMSGVTFVTDYNDWVSGTCLIIFSNVFEFCFDLLRGILMNNPNNMRMGVIIDSLDMMIRREDAKKSSEDSLQVAGGALLTSVFLKKVSVSFSRLGHWGIFISQIRESIKLNPYEKTPPKLGNSSGGNALSHAADFVLSFEERYKSDVIYENDDDKNKPIGHFCRIRVLKSNNEINGTEIRYPIRYGQIGGRSVFREKEILDILLQYQLLTKSMSWFRFAPDFREELIENGFDIAEQYHGLKNVYKLLDENSMLVDYLYQKLKDVV